LYLFPPLSRKGLRGGKNSPSLNLSLQGRGILTRLRVGADAFCFCLDRHTEQVLGLDYFFMPVL